MVSRDFGLYRESLGRYLFDGRPEIYFSTRLTRAERVLLEIHEHAHWERANATTYGREQMALAEAARLKSGEPVAAELEKCLETSVEFSRLVYEGAALAAERSSLTAVGSTPPDWNSLLETELYGEAHRLFGDWLRKLPYSAGLQASIAANAAELCLNSVSILDDTKSDHDTISARSPMSLRAEDVRALLVKRCPDSLLRSLSKQLVIQTREFVSRLDAAAGEVIGQANLTADALRTDGALASADAMTEGRLIYVIYETLRGFAEESGAIRGTQEYGLLQDIFPYRYADWMRKLLADDLVGVPEAPGIRLEPPSEEEVRSDLDFFATVYITIHRPERDRATDLPVTSWEPVHQAFRDIQPEERQLYLAITTAQVPPRAEGSTSEAWFELSAARAVIAPHDDFAWKFGRSRYSIKVPASGLRKAVEEILPYNPAIAVPLDLIELPAGSISHLGVLPQNATVGVLLENVPFARWAHEIERMSNSFRTMSHYYEVGPAETTFIVTFGIADSARWFLYMPLSISMRLFIDAGAASLTQIAGHELAWELDEVPMAERFRAASVLICEQYVLNGL
jgi:hypothetical protein